MPPDELCTKTVRQHRLESQLFQQLRPHLLLNEQFLEMIFQFSPKDLILHLKSEILGHSQHLRQCELGQQLLHLFLDLFVEVFWQFLDLFQIGQDTCQLLAIRISYSVPDATEHLLDPRLLPSFQLRKNQE